MNTPARVLTVEQLAARLAEVEQELASARAAPHPNTYSQIGTIIAIQFNTVSAHSSGAKQH